MCSWGVIGNYSTAIGRSATLMQFLDHVERPPAPWAQPFPAPPEFFLAARRGMHPRSAPDPAWRLALLLAILSSRAQGRNLDAPWIFPGAFLFVIEVCA